MKTRKEWKHSCPIFLVHVKDRQTHRLMLFLHKQLVLTPVITKLHLHTKKRRTTFFRLFVCLFVKFRGSSCSSPFVNRSMRAFLSALTPLLLSCALLFLLCTGKCSHGRFSYHTIDCCIRNLTQTDSDTYRRDTNKLVTNGTPDWILVGIFISGHSTCSIDQVKTPCAICHPIGAFSVIFPRILYHTSDDDVFFGGLMVLYRERYTNCLGRGFEGMHVVQHVGKCKMNQESGRETE